MFTVGADVSDYKFTTLEGKKIKMEDYIGKKCVIIEFWADYCKTCTKFMKSLQELKSGGKYKDVEFLGLVCEWGVSNNRATSYIEYYNITFPQIWIAKKSERFKVAKNKKDNSGMFDYTLPKRVFIDKSGRVIIEDREKLEDEAAIKEWLKDILSKCSDGSKNLM